jgi:hypothetical protein
MVYEVLDRLCAATHATDDKKIFDPFLVLVFLAILAELKVVTVVSKAVVTHVRLVVNRTSTLVLVVVEDSGLVQDVLDVQIRIVVIVHLVTASSRLL